MNPIKHDENILYGAILNTQFRDKITVVRTVNIMDTYKYLCFLYKKILNKPAYFTTGGNDMVGAIVPYEQTIKLKKKENWWGDQLKSEENAIVADDVIASIEMAAGDSDGTDGATVAAGIHAIAEGTFSNDIILYLRV